MWELGCQLLILGSAHDLWELACLRWHRRSQAGKPHRLHREQARSHSIFYNPQGFSPYQRGVYTHAEPSARANVQVVDDPTSTMVRIST